MTGLVIHIHQRVRVDVKLRAPIQRGVDAQLLFAIVSVEGEDRQEPLTVIATDLWSAFFLLVARAAVLADLAWVKQVAESESAAS